MRVPTIKGKKVILRPLSLKDAKNFTQWLSDPEVTKFLEIHEQPRPSLKDEREYIVKKKRSGNGIQFALDSIDGTHIGTIGLDTIDRYNKRASYGVFIGNKKYWGQGCGTEAGRLILEYGFRKLKLTRIYLHVYSFNIRGYKSYRRLGFRQEGVLRQHRFRSGHYYDEVIMGILRDEFFKNSKKK